MQRSFFLTFVFTFCFISSFSAQDFSGEFVKKITYIPKNNSIDIDSIKNSNYGEVSRYSIKPGFYKSQYFKNGAPGYSYTYHASTQLMYDDQPEKNYITYRDSKREGNYTYEEPIMYKDSIEVILGYKCYLVTQQTSYGFTKKYYSDEIRVAYESFKNHSVGNWYNDLKFTGGAIPLKTIVEYEDYTSIVETLEVNKMDLSDATFSLPENKMKVASYSALDERVTLKNPSVETRNCYRSSLEQHSELIAKSNLKTIYTQFILTEKGAITHIDVYEKDTVGLYKIAIDIIKNCGIEFIPGKINGKPVASEVYFPIEFN